MLTGTPMLPAVATTAAVEGPASVSTADRSAGLSRTPTSGGPPAATVMAARTAAAAAAGPTGVAASATHVRATPSGAATTAAVTAEWLMPSLMDWTMTAPATPADDRTAARSAGVPVGVAGGDGRSGAGGKAVDVGGCQMWTCESMRRGWGGTLQTRSRKSQGRGGGGAAEEGRCGGETSWTKE